MLVGAVHAALHHRERQLQLRDHLALRIQMQREAHHRLQNLLATVQAMAAMSRRSGGDGTTALRDFEGRLRALASVHADLDGAGHSASRFARVAAGVLAPYGEQAETRVTIAAVDDALTPEAGRTLALCLHELATNALKYGALADPAGRVELRFERGAGGASLHWVEHGASPPTPPAGQGYGTRYLERALGQLFDAEPSLSFADPGFRLDVEGPAPRLFAD
jgi:two-component sensor histidine kinase